MRRLAPFVLALGLLVPASATPQAVSIQAYQQRVSEASARVEDAAAIERALGLVHARWAERGPPGRRVDACADPDAGALVALSRTLGSAHRDAVEGARVYVAAVNEAAALPTVEPLLLTADRARLTELSTRSERALRAHAAFADWQRKHVEPSARGCSPALRAGPGVADPVPGRRGAVAVTFARSGRLCPGAEPVGAGDVVLVDGPVCYGDAGCGCAPEPVLPGAVLAP